MIEGAANGAAITAAEGALATPEPASKPLVVSGIAGLIASDIAFTTKMQMQLLLEIGEVYECPFSKEDEDDVWIILKAAFGVRGTEQVGAYGRFIFTEAARKQFRAFLRSHGIRRTAQKVVAKIAGREVAKYVSERALMALIPVANAIIGGWFNYSVTNRVGKWAKVKAKIRASAFRSVDELSALDREAAVAILPVILYIGTADDQLVDNTVTLYAQAAKRLKLSAEEISENEKIIDEEDLENTLWQRLDGISHPNAREHMLDIAITSAAATRLSVVPAHHAAVERLARQLSVPYTINALERRIAFLSR